MRNSGNAWPRGTVMAGELRFQPRLHEHEWGVLNKARVLVGYVDGGGFTPSDYLTAQADVG